jgi:hypothetical protein
MTRDHLRPAGIQLATAIWMIRTRTRIIARIM